MPLNHMALNLAYRYFTSLLRIFFEVYLQDRANISKSWLEA